MPSTIFPPWPHFVFAILEPISLIGGWLCPILNLESFVTDQIPSAHSQGSGPGSPVPAVALAPAEIHPTSFALAYQLANLYGLLALIGAGVLHSTSEPKVLRNYLVALAVADVGHIYVTYLAMGPELFFDLGAWNVLTWGNVGATGFLFVNRVLYFLGVFGFAGELKGKRA